MGRGIECSDITVFDERDGGTFFGFADPDGNSWAVQQLKARGEKPLIPVEHRDRFGADVATAPPQREDRAYRGSDTHRVIRPVGDSP